MLLMCAHKAGGGATRFPLAAAGAELMHAKGAVTLTHAVDGKHEDHHYKGITTHTHTHASKHAHTHTHARAYASNIKGEEGMKGDASRLIWWRGGLRRAGVGGGLPPEINESPEL